ncbi:multidrug effflux MFS transporter [Corynebacterium stationis]|uniref:multidrug effflux MFS transporter n=1 Tax=Corynebacterium stationis TaxID=1705 RepID=UPI00076F84EF|nr:multidrug effflux MFS transporter [Corynebacterium stationis]AMJ45450.1 MFS transporter [Corynebacterium stationis]AQX71904.1 MFS transporter [Corynebacterium stationis]ASJ19584.1 Bcr/CflA family drug resistance efflux transporter [Corynebacterium stationis]HJG63804.1 multidrug effflux MFS transporter [Corynebacterium stationis]
MAVSLLLALALLSATAPFATDMYLPTLPAVGAEFGAPDSVVQLTLSGFFVGMALGQLMVGPISDVIGRRRLLIAGAIVALLASAIAALSPSIAIFVAARFLQGLGGGACVVLARAMVPDLLSGREAAKTYSLLMAILAIAPAVAPIVGGLLAEPIGWRGIYWVLTGLHAVQLLVVLKIVPETGGQSPGGQSATGQRFLARVLSNYATVLKSPRFWGFLTAMAFAFASMFCYIAASSFVFQQEFGLSPRGYAAVFALNALGMCVGSFVNSRCIDKLGTKKVMLGGLCLALLGNVLLLIAVLSGAGLVWIILALLLCISPNGVIMGNSTAMATGLMRTRAGSVTAIMGFGQSVLAAVVGPLMGLGGNTAVVMSLGMSACIAIAAAGAVLATRGFTD